jgi:hypothetical protein
MPHITGHDRSQPLLLPESLDDYVGPENPVRFIEAFVDGLDLAAAGFGFQKLQQFPPDGQRSSPSPGKSGCIPPRVAQAARQASGLRCQRGHRAKAAVLRVLFGHILRAL